MSFVQEFKNYLSFCHFTHFSDSNSVFQFLKYNFLYFQQFVFYLISFKWLFLFSEFTVPVPDSTYTNFKELFTVPNSTSVLFDYQTEMSDFAMDPFLICWISLLFSFFYWLPHSSIHFLLIRRLVVEGLPSGITAISATFLGQFSFLLISFSGSRPSIFSWIGLEPWNYVGNLFCVFILIYTLVHSSIKRVKRNETQILGRIFVIHFVLALVEQYGLIPYMHSLSNFNSIPIEPNLNCKLAYLLGFVVGSIIWIGLFGFLILRLSQFMAIRITKSYSNWIQTVNFFCLTCIMASIIASLPYYGLDYVLLAPIGFYAEDPATDFVQLKTNIRDVSKGRLGEYSAHSSIDTDISPYDRGRYSTGSEVELTFEDMNFQGEYIWRSRTDRLASGSAGIVNQFMSRFLPKTASESISPKIESSRNAEIESSLPISLLNTRYNFESLLDRFLSDYNGEVRDELIATSGREFDQFSAFSELVKYGFDSFASLEEIESDEFEEELGKKIKMKYYKNPIYKFLLSVETQNFLNRQPPSHSLQIQEEKELWLKKNIMTNYYNSLLAYSRLPYREIFVALFGDTKSYANRVYNQQYKGTLKILRRLFSIDLMDPTTQTILKFDQLLYQPTPAVINHEELHTIPKNRYLTEFHSLPFYVGWDLDQRRLVLSTRFLNKENIFQIVQLNTPKSDFRFEFTSWPLAQIRVDTQKGQFMFHKFNEVQSDLQKDLFEYTENGEYETHLIYETLPSLIKRVDLRNKDKSLISLKPVYGAFTWSKQHSLH